MANLSEIQEDRFISQNKTSIQINRAIKVKNQQYNKILNNLYG